MLALALMFVLESCAGSPAFSSAQSAAQADDLDAAIRAASDYINKQLPKGNKLVILNIQSEFPALSEYIIDELIANTVNDKVFSVVDRQQLDTIRAELEFQTSGEVSDESAQSIGQMLGAQIIVSGAVSRVGDLYRLRVRALNVQSAQIAGQFNRNIPDGPTVSALAQSQATGYGGESQGGSARSVSPAASGGTATVPASAVPTAAPVVKDVYTIGETGPAGGLIFYSSDAVRTSSANPPVDRAYNHGENGPAGGVVFYNAAYTRTAKVPPPVDREYQIGDTGPAGGIIFFINPGADAWKYLEAAPANTEKQTFWCSEVFSVNDIKGSRSVGSGKPNSEYIMRQAVNRGGGFDWAAEVCDSLVVNGYDDWFLPSRDELHQMYGNLKRKGVGGFKDEMYWSSTPNGDVSPDGRMRIWYEDFSNGNQSCFSNTNSYYGNMHIKYRVRAIRQF
jgi:TolB-like protein